MVAAETGLLPGRENTGARGLSGAVSNEKEGCDRAPGEGQAATGPGLSGVRIKSHPRPSGH